MNVLLGAIFDVAVANRRGRFSLGKGVAWS